ncbi:hypothetical protein D3C74_321390 [compost metagenome]
MQNQAVLAIHPLDLGFRGCGFHLRFIIDDSVPGRHLVTYNDDGPQRRQLLALHPRQQRRRRDQRNRPAVLQAILNCRFHKRLEQRPHDRADLKRAQHTHVQLRRPRHKDEYPIAFRDTVFTQHVGKPVRQPLHVLVRI